VARSAATHCVASDILTLSADEAQQLWLTVLRRQGLAGGAKLASVLDAADRGLGLHAARLPSPYATLLARLENPAAAADLYEPAMPPPVMTVRCMRKTLHTLPVPLAAVAHRATRHFRERDALRAAHNVGVTPARLTTLADRVVALLTMTGPLGNRQIEAELTGTGVTIPAARAALKYAWERGELTYLNQAQHWNREDRAFAATSALFPGFNRMLDRTDAVGALLHAYFDRYGPATVRDAVWWSGLSQADVYRALAQSARPVKGYLTPWATEPAYAFADQPEAPATPDAPGAAIDFLAHEDVALKAYFETRRRYLGQLTPSRAFNQIGEVLPTIMRDGLVIGRWAWDKHQRRVGWQAFDRIGRPARSRCAERAAELTIALRARYDARNLRPRPATRSALLSGATPLPG
jgi:hypothetical protein